MPFVIDFDPIEQLTHVRAFGDSNFHEGQAMIRAVLAHPDTKSGIPVLLDIRELAFIPSTQEAHQFAREMAGSLSARNANIAVVANDGGNFVIAKEVETAAIAQGASVHAFKTIEEAKRWLHRRITPHDAQAKKKRRSRRRNKYFPVRCPPLLADDIWHELLRPPEERRHH